MAAGDGGSALGVAMSNPTLDGLRVTGATVVAAVSTSGTVSAASISVASVLSATASGATLGFYGASPGAQPSSTVQAVAISTAAVSVSATQWAFATSTQADGIVRLVNRLRSDLVTLGLIAGS